MHADVPMILANTSSVGDHVCTSVHTSKAGYTVRTKLYNKVVSNLEAGEVREPIGVHLSERASAPHILASRCTGPGLHSHRSFSVRLPGGSLGGHGQRGGSRGLGPGLPLGSAGGTRPVCGPAASQAVGEPGRVPLSPGPPPRGSARRSAFPRPSRALHPHRPEPGEKSVGRVTEGRRGIAPAEVFAGWQVERLLGVLWIWGWGPPGEEIALELVARPPAAPGAPALFRPEPGGVARRLGVWGGNEPYRVPRDLAASLDWNTWPDLSRSPAPRACQHQWEEARRLSSYICPCPTLRRWPTHRVPFRAPALPTYHKQLLGNCRNLLLFCNSATQLSVPLLRGNVCIRGRAICDHWVCPPLCLIGCAGCLRSRRAATFLHICISPISGHQLGKALHLFGSSALSRVVAVLPLVEPKHVAASIRQAADMLETLFAVPGQELRDCAALCNFGHLLEVEGRDLYANRMALVGPPNPRNQGRGAAGGFRGRDRLDAIV